MKIMKLAIAALAALFAVAPASATIRIFDYIARVDQVDALVPAGTMINGSFSYDDSLTPSTVFYGEKYNRADFEHPSFTLSLNFLGQSYSVGGEGGVTDAFGGDEEDGFGIRALSDSRYVSLSIWDPRNAWISGTALPTSFPSPLWQGPFDDLNNDDDLTVPHGELSLYLRPSRESFTAVIISVTPAGLVPEPATWAMMIIGFGAVGSAMRKRRAEVPARA